MKLKFGIVGYGPRAKSLVKGASGRMEFLGGFDPSAEVQAILKAKNLVAAENYEDLINTDGINAIIIGSPPQFHVDQTVKALEAGLHVFSEVPMAIDKDGTEKILTADEKNPKAKYMMGENYIYHQNLLFAANLIDTGKIGPATYCESEYIHDVSYRWRGNTNDYKNSKLKAGWYSLFDPLMYAHAIAPAQFALGGMKNPLEFEQVMSYANDIGGDDGVPVCKPAKAFQVGLFKGTGGEIAKCASAYVFAREPTRRICLLTGRYGTYESYSNSKAPQLFIANGFNITHHHRVGKKKKVSKKNLFGVVKSMNMNMMSDNVRCLDEWINSIIDDRAPILDSKRSANITMAGIASSESARSGKPVDIPLYNSKS
jgi:predicted dehydrogenase